MNTTTTTTTTATPPRIAINKDQFTDALFTPGGTFDGYIDKQMKNGIRLFFRGETYVLNRENVFCLATKQSDGKTWYSYGGKINALSYAATCALAEHIREMMKPAPTPAAAALAMQRKHNKQQATLGACVILAPGDPAERDPALMAEAVQKAIYLAEMEKRNTATQTAEPNNDSTRKTYVVEYMNGKTRRFQCFNYAEAVQKAHAVSPAVADITEL